MLRAVVAAGATAALWLRAYYDFSSRRASDGAQEAGASYNAVVLGTELLLSASADSLSPVSSAEDIASQLLSHKLLWPDCTTEIVAELHRDLEVATKHCSQGLHKFLSDIGADAAPGTVEELYSYEQLHADAGTRSADRFEAACQRLRGKLLDAVAFQCFEQNPYVKSLQIRSKAGEALSAAASSGDILMLRLIDFVSPDVIEGPEGAAAVQAAMKAAECSDAWRRLSALAAAKWLLSRGAHLPQRSELAKGARILQDSIRCLPEDSAAYAEEIGEHGQVLAHAIPKTDINSCSQSVLQKYNLSPMAKDFKQQEQTVLAEHVNALIKLVSSQASDSNRGISTLHAAARRSGSAAAEAQQWYIEQLAAWHPDQHSTVALSSTYKGLSQVQLHAFTSYGSSGNSSSNDGGSSNDHGSNGNGNGSRSSGGGSTSEGSSVALDRRPVSIFFVTGRQPQYASAQPNGFLNRRHVSVTGRPDNDMQYVVLTFSTATAWDDIQNLLTLLESCGTGMQLPPGVQLETRVNEGEWWRRVDVATVAGRTGEPLLTVHGYNASWCMAVRDALKLRQALGRTGPVIAFDWPSCRSKFRYLADRRIIDEMVEPMQKMLHGMQRGVRRPVQVLAHSMGCQLVSMALAQNFPDDNDFIVSDNLRRELSPNTIRVGNRLGALVENQLPAQDVRQRVSSFVFVAPDVAGPVMRRRIQTISQMGMVTVYCADDWALFISAFIRLVQYLGSGPRAGHSANLAALGLHHDTVDATGHNRNWLGHSYLYESHRMVNDVAAALPAHLPRGLISHA